MKEEAGCSINGHRYPALDGQLDATAREKTQEITNPDALNIDRRNPRDTVGVMLRPYRRGPSNREGGTRGLKMEIIVEAIGNSSEVKPLNTTPKEIPLGALQKVNRVDFPTQLGKAGVEMPRAGKQVQERGSPEL
jgi:hypothetical protein